MNLYKCRECGKVFPEEEIKEYHEDCTPAGETATWTYIYKASPCCAENYDEYEEEEEEEE